MSSINVDNIENNDQKDKETNTFTKTEAVDGGISRGFKPKKGDQQETKQKNKASIDQSRRESIATDSGTATPHDNEETLILPGRKRPIPFSAVNSKDRSGRTLIYKYAARGDYDTSEMLLKAGANLRTYDHAGWTPLHEACLEGHVDIVRLMLTYDAEVNALGGDGDTPLHDAVGNIHREVVQVLLEFGASLELVNESKQTAIEFGLERLQEMKEENDENNAESVTKLEKIIETLQEWREMTNKVVKRDESGQCLLHHAATAGSLTEVKRLISFGADINATDSNNWTPLHNASIAGHSEVVEHLLIYGAEVDPLGFEEETPLHDAAANGHMECVKILLQYGAESLRGNSRGKFPVDLVPKDGRNSNLISLLQLPFQHWEPIRTASYFPRKIAVDAIVAREVTAASQSGADMKKRHVNSNERFAKGGLDDDREGPFESTREEKKFRALWSSIAKTSDSDVPTKANQSTSRVPPSATRPVEVNPPVVKNPRGRPKGSGKNANQQSRSGSIVAQLVPGTTVGGSDSVSPTIIHRSSAPTEEKILVPNSSLSPLSIIPTSSAVESANKLVTSTATSHVVGSIDSTVDSLSSNLEVHEVKPNAEEIGLDMFKSDIVRERERTTSSAIIMLPENFSPTNPKRSDLPRPAKKKKRFTISGYQMAGGNEEESATDLFATISADSVSEIKSPARSKSIPEEESLAHDKTPVEVKIEQVDSAVAELQASSGRVDLLQDVKLSDFRQVPMIPLPTEQIYGSMEKFETSAGGQSVTLNVKDSPEYELNDITELYINHRFCSKMSIFPPKKRILMISDNTNVPNVTANVPSIPNYLRLPIKKRTIVSLNGAANPTGAEYQRAAALQIGVGLPLFRFLINSAPSDGEREVQSLTDFQLAILFGMESGSEFLEKYSTLKHRVAKTSEKVALQQTSIPKSLIKALHANINSEFNSFDYATNLNLETLDIQFVYWDQNLKSICESKIQQINKEHNLDFPWLEDVIVPFESVAAEAKNLNQDDFTYTHKLKRLRAS